jgi:hypothetical protein
LARGRSKQTALASSSDAAAGDRLAGRRRKLQDVFTEEAPRRERDVADRRRGDDVVSIPGIVENPGGKPSGYDDEH